MTDTIPGSSPTASVPAALSPAASAPAASAPAASAPAASAPAASAPAASAPAAPPAERLDLRTSALPAAEKGESPQLDGGRVDYADLPGVTVEASNPATVEAEGPGAVEMAGASHPVNGRGAASAVRHFEEKLAYETDPSDVQAAFDASERFVLVDSRGDAAWTQGRIPRAMHLPTAWITDRARDLIPLDMPVVVYCWGPGCNGSTKAALHFARLGYSVREMIGGFEYWAREGLSVVNDQGPIMRTTDELTAPVSAITCDC